MIQRIIGVTELQRGFRRVFDEVAEQQVPYILTRGGRAEAVLLPYQEFERYQALEEGDVVAEFRRIMARLAEANHVVSEAEVASDVRRAVAERRRPGKGRRR